MNDTKSKQTSGVPQLLDPAPCHHGFKCYLTIFMKLQVVDHRMHCAISVSAILHGALPDSFQYPLLKS